MGLGEGSDCFVLRVHAVAVAWARSNRFPAHHAST